MVLVVVYVGAVAVLFMFVVMMLDINFVRMREGFMQLPAGRARWSASILLVELVLVGGTWALRGDHRRRPCRYRRATGGDEHRGDRQAALHHYFYLFQAAGMILLVAIIGAITLTLRQRPGAAAGHRHAGQPRRARVRRAAQGALGGGHLMTISRLAHYLTLAAILFTLGVFGIFLNRKNVIIILMSIELILLAININFVAFSRLPGRPRRARSSPCSC